MSAKKTTKTAGNVPTQETVQPAPAQQAPAQPQAYDPNMYYQKPVDPNKGKAKWLTFEYLVAMLSTVLAASLLVRVIVSMFGLWFSSTASVTATSVGGWLSSILSLDTVTPGTGLVAASIMTVLLSVVALVCFKRVSRTIPDRKDYTSSLEYKLVTYGGFALLVLPILVLIAKIVGVLVSSLLFIGVSGAGEVYKSLYLAEFFAISAGSRGDDLCGYVPQRYHRWQECLKYFGNCSYHRNFGCPVCWCYYGGSKISR